MFFISLAAAATVAGVQLPDSLTTGAQPLQLVSCGVRDTLWIDHYVAGLYLPPGRTLQELRSPKTAKAVRLQVIDGAWLPERIPGKWRGALEAELEQEPMSRVRTAYRGLSKGDVVTFAYLPGEGVTMSVNRSTVLRAQGHDVIDAILETWSGEDPISGKLQRLALKHPC